MRLTSIATLITLLGLVASPGTADEKPARHVEKAGGFSFVPPKDWIVREFPGLKFKVVVGPVANGFAPNINFVDETANVALSDYVAGNKKSFQAFFKNYKVISETRLKTNDGAPCIRLVIENARRGKQLRQSFYFFSLTRGKKLVATCTALADGGEKLDPLFAACLKTFKFEKQE